MESFVVFQWFLWRTIVKKFLGTSLRLLGTGQEHRVLCYSSFGICQLGKTSHRRRVLTYTRDQRVTELPHHSGFGDPSHFSSVAKIASFEI